MSNARLLKESYPATKQELAKTSQLVYDLLVKEGSTMTAELFLEHGFFPFHQNEQDIKNGEEELEIAFMQPETGRIFLNIDAPTVTWTPLITHEIGHFFLDHSFRAIRKIAKILGFPVHKLKAEQKADIEKAIYRDEFAIANISGDVEIANLLYDDDQEDKLKKYLVMYGNACSVIVKETFPEYIGWSFEDILEDLYHKHYDDIDIPEFEVIEGKLVNDTTFVGDDGTVYGRS